MTLSIALEKRWSACMNDDVADRLRRRNALKLLAVHRQAKPDQETAAAYLVALQDMPADVLEQACHDIGYAPRGEHELAWPELGAIRARCEVIMRYRREQRELARPKLSDGDTPLDFARLKHFKEDVAKLVKQKAMPSSGTQAK